jgi:predicted nucleic acid-binding protein
MPWIAANHKKEDVASVSIDVPERPIQSYRISQIVDALTAILMREHGIRRICTRDTDFHQFAFLEVIDPLRS